MADIRGEKVVEVREGEAPVAFRTFGGAWNLLFLAIITENEISSSFNPFAKDFLRYNI